MALAFVWALVILVFWFGLFVASMRPGLVRVEAIDLFGYFFPKFTYASEQLARGSLPLWNPYEYGGVPLLGAGQSAVLYPPRMLAFGLLAPVPALHAFMLFHYLLLGVGAFVMLRTFGLGVAGAAFGTLCFVFQPAMMNSHYNPIRIASFTWVPWMVATFVRTMEQRRASAALALAAVAALQVLAGYPEYSVDTALVLAVLWPAAAIRSGRIGGRAAAVRGTLLVAGAALLAGAIAGPQIVATLEMFGESVRAAQSVTFMAGIGFEVATFGEGLGGWVSSISTFGYLPVLGVVLLAIGLVSPERPYRFALLGVWLLASVAYTEPLRTLPPFSFFRSFLCWASLLYVPFATFAGAGFDRLAGVLTGGRLRPREAACALVALAGALPFSAGRSLAWLVVTSAVLAAGRIGKARWVRVAIAAALVATLATIWTWVPPPLAPSLPHRYAAGQASYAAVADTTARAAEVRAACGAGQAGRLLAPVETLLGVPVVARLSAVQGYPESLAPARMTRLLDAAGLVPDRIIPLDWTRLARSGGVLRLLDVGCMVAEPGHEAALAQLGFMAGGRLADGRTAWVRAAEGIAFLASGSRRADADEVLASLSEGRFDVRREVIFDESVADGGFVRGACSDAGCDVAPGSVTPLESTPERMAFRIEAAAPSHLVVAVNYAPGWRAEVDGRTALVARADYTVMAVPVDAGTHTVVLHYRPPGFTLALALSVLGLAVLAGGAVRALRRAG